MSCRVAEHFWRLTFNANGPFGDNRYAFEPSPLFYHIASPVASVRWLVALSHQTSVRLTNWPLPSMIRTVILLATIPLLCTQELPLPPAVFHRTAAQGDENATMYSLSPMVGEGGEVIFKGG